MQAPCARAWAFSISRASRASRCRVRTRKAWLDRLLAPRRCRNRAARGWPHAAGHDGRLKGDLTLFNWGDGTWWIMGSYYLREWHMRWFHDHMADGVHGARPGRRGGGLLPVRSEIPRGDRKADRGPVGALPFMGCGDFDIGLIRCKVGRMSVTGELGYEIHCSAMGEHIALRRGAAGGGRGSGGDHANTGSTRSCRCGWRRASASGRGIHPGLHGGRDRHGPLDRWDKGDFIGRDAALAERDGNGPAGCW
jgi:dimethylglycine dehydrogenase